MRAITILSFLFFQVVSLTALAAEVLENKTSSVTGFPLPRFASLRMDKVNMRTGPGTRYPIEWVFLRADTPVEITAEFDVWRRVKDSEGAEGWVHQSALYGRRTLIVTGDAARPLHQNDDSLSPVMAWLDPGVTGRLLSCGKEWCKIRVDGVKGYLAKEALWGAYADERFR